METSAPASWSVPFRLGPFEALERLGSGGFAAVFRARDVRSGQLVALKVVPPGTDDESVRRLMREARAVSRLSHPNIVQVHECGVTPDGAYVAMELLVGRTLQDILDDSGRLPVERALLIAMQVLDGLAAAHASRIIHRDVKPGNIFITQDLQGVDVPHLLDFGVSKMGMLTGSTSQHERTLPGTALGTPGFMAPEQYGSAHAADARADVYGVAATLYAMLTGRLPFDAGTYESWVMKVKGERAPAITAAAPHVSPELARTIDRALARDPDARWPTARDFARALMGAAPPGIELTATFRRASDSFTEGTAPALTARTAPLASNAPSTPRTDSVPSTEPRPPPAVVAERKTEPPDPRKAKGSSRTTNARKSSRTRGGGLWFASGALVGAILAALGAAIAFWARSRPPPPPVAPEPPASISAAPTAPHEVSPDPSAEPSHPDPAPNGKRPNKAPHDRAGDSPPADRK